MFGIPSDCNSIEIENNFNRYLYSSRPIAIASRKEDESVIVKSVEEMENANTNI